MKRLQVLSSLLQSAMVNCLRFVCHGVWGEQSSSKTTLTIDRRLLLLCSLVAIFGLIQLCRGFDGVEATVVSDTFFSKSWPNAGGRVRLRHFEWWGLKRVEYIAESQFYTDEDDPDKKRQKRWMIINSTAPKSEVSGRQEFPWPLFYVNNDLFTYYAFDGRDMKWFNFQQAEANPAPEQ